MNTLKNHFSFEKEKTITKVESSLPDDIREALEIRDEAMEFQKEINQPIIP